MLIRYLDVLSQTLAAELMSSLQTTRILSHEARGTVAVKTVKGRRYVYLQKMVNGKYEYSYLGPESAVDVEKAKNALKMKKEVLDFLEQKIPGTKRNFLYAYVENKPIPKDEEGFKECKECGFPSHLDVCGLCLLRKRLEDGNRASN